MPARVSRHCHPSPYRIGERLLVVTKRQRIRSIVVLAVTIALVTAAAAIRAQSGREPRIWRGGFGGIDPPRLPTPQTFVGGFNFCRLFFDSNRREKRGWSTDYPGADINLSVRLGEMTKIRVTRVPGSDPEYVVVRPTDAALFQCPLVFAEDVGTAIFSDDEAAALRRYLEKGGFMFLSDYWGPRSQEQLEEELGRILPRDRYPVDDIPMSHSVWHAMFDLKEIPQMASIQSWRRTGGSIFERGDDRDTVEVRGISDSHGRLMVLMVHNSDIPDGWEREGEDPAYFNLFSPGAYTVAINAVLYAMTH